jgi:predicted small lipoprotein YifL
MRTLRLMMLVSLTGAVLGCGQKGPLVLPDAQHPRKQIGVSRPPAAKPAPAPAPATPAPAPSPPAGAPAPAPGDPAPGEAKPDAAPQP